MKSLFLCLLCAAGSLGPSWAESTNQLFNLQAFNGSAKWLANWAPVGSAPGARLRPAPGATNVPPAVLVLRTTTPDEAKALKPGVYDTYPNSCVVIVPGPHHDDVAIIGRDSRAGSAIGVCPMPTISPELQFIPRSPKDSKP